MGEVAQADINLEQWTGGLGGGLASVKTPQRPLSVGRAAAGQVGVQHRIRLEAQHMDSASVVSLPSPPPPPLFCQLVVRMKGKDETGRNQAAAFQPRPHLRSSQIPRLVIPM